MPSSDSTVRILQRDLRTNCAAKLERRFPEHTEPETRAAGYIGSNIVTCCVHRNCSLVQSELANGPTAKNSDSNTPSREETVAASLVLSSAVSSDAFALAKVRTTLARRDD